MSDYDCVIDKAIVELAMAKLMGAKHGGAALRQARFHINLLLEMPADFSRQVLGDENLLPDSIEKTIEEGHPK